MQQDTSRPFVLTATGSGYFRIWIVNLLLSIVTVGLYSPWAKVRRIRYFYGNTLFDGSPFEFHGRPLALLVGRIVGVVLLVAYTQAAKFSLTLWLVVVVVAVLVALFPWLLWKSLRFRLGNSSWRGIHFAFDGTVSSAYATFVPMILMVLVPTFVLLITQHTLTVAQPALRPMIPYFVASALVLLCVPWFYWRLRAYQHRNARLGATPFAFDGKVRTAYAIAGKTVLIGMLFLVLGVIAGGLAGGLLWIFGDTFHLAAANGLSLTIGGAVGYLVLLSAFFATRAMIQNFVWNGTTLAGARFVSVVSRTHLWRIETVNLFLTLLTLGFFWPFAVVRSMRYRIGALRWSGDSDGLVGDPARARVGAAGEETVDLFGFELAL